jgi:SCY1-like protein 2
MLPVLDFSTVKNDVFPPIASTFGRTKSLAIKIRGLESFAVLCGGSVGDAAEPEDDISGVVLDQKSNKTSTTSILDKYTVQEKVVPLLKAIRTKEPAVMMAALRVLRQVGKIADTEFLALEVLPILWNFSLGPLLSLQQFQEFMALINSLSTKVEREHTKKLQELSCQDEAAGSHNSIGGTLGTNSSMGVPDVEGTKNDFERLVLGRNGTSNTKSDDLWDSWGSEPTTKPSQAAGQTSRSITPDLNQSSFPSLEPSRERSLMSQTFPALQPATPSWNQSTPLSPAPSTTNTMAAPSFATLGSMRTAATPSFGQTTQQRQASNFSAFTIPPPRSGNYQQPQPSQFPSLQPASNPWAVSGSAPSQNGTAQTSQQQKQGLDKYESLL